MKKIYLLITLLFFALSSFATPQVADILIWKGDTLQLFSNPIDLRDDGNSITNKITENLIEQSNLLYPNETEEDRYFISSGCWRGYVAEWIILNDSLFLNNIYACYDENLKVNLEELFPDKNADEKLFASWVSGELVIPKGECILYVHMNYESVYEEEIILDFEKGVLKNIESYQNRIAKEANFHESFPDFIYLNINWGMLPDLKYRDIMVYITIQPNEQGLLDRIVTDYTYMIDGTNIVGDINNIFIKEGIRIAKLIPDWDVIYKRGKIRYTGILIRFCEEEKNKYVH